MFFWAKGIDDDRFALFVIVYDDKSLSFAQKLIKQYGLTTQVAKSPKHYY
ncbi:MAG: hypothetical protein OHK0039_11960 [Bacteroidia bacterium]